VLVLLVTVVLVLVSLVLVAVEPPLPVLPPPPVVVSSPHAARAAGIMHRIAPQPNQLITFIDLPAPERKTHRALEPASADRTRARIEDGRSPSAERTTTARTTRTALRRVVPSVSE
jgi:hypothetical protein